MSTLCKAFSGEEHAREAVEELVAAGSPRSSIRLLTGSPLHDIRAERVGTFAGSIGPDAPVGRFAGPPWRRRRGNGTYAGDPDRRRKGSFGDVEHDVIVTFDSDAEHPHTATHGAVERLLNEVAPDGESAERLVDELHVGHALVIAEAPPPTGPDPRRSHVPLAA
ncbi:MAG TPA: hypothetical protein VFZ00_21455 [Solirubrobacter sp.]|jgi:hypothetical protein|nr:hypothetical protein [Solirubrobacter sp.]